MQADADTQWTDNITFCLVSALVLPAVCCFENVRLRQLLGALMTTLG
jgi:hypothetical protein